jgi:hypothetical protein
MLKLEINIYADSKMMNRFILIQHSLTKDSGSVVNVVIP